MEQLGDVYSPFSFSPDGKELAFVVLRSKVNQTEANQDTLIEQNRADVWLASVETGKSTNLTKGARNGSGYFLPTWSPDGRRLAMVSIKGGNITLWVWDRESGQIRLLSERALNLWAINTSYLWVSNDKLACSVLPEGEKPRSGSQQALSSQETAIREWLRARQGQEPTASVLESGLTPTTENQPQGQLLLIDAVTGKSRVIATGLIHSLKLSSNKQYLAFLKQTSVFQPDPFRSLASRPLDLFYIMGYQLMVANTDGDLLSPGPVEVANVYKMEWSADSKQMAIIGEQAGAADETPSVFVYTLQTRALRKVLPDTLEASTLIWSTNNKLLVRANQKHQDNRYEQTNRLDWWVTQAGENVRNLTAEMKSPPVQFLEEPIGSFIGVAAGNLWQIEIAGDASAKTLSTDLDGQITSLVWPRGSSVTTPGLNSKLVVETKRGQLSDYYLIDRPTGRKFILPKPDPQAKIVNFDPQSNSAIMTANTRRGSFLWLSRPNLQTPLLTVETNTFLSGIAEGERRQIEYQSLDGRTLKGWLILPVNYHEGQKYPLVTWVYPASMYGDLLPGLTNLNTALALNLQLLAAHGYAVLLPSLPVNPAGPTSDVYLELTNGTLPAVDKVIQMGIADPKRLGLMGQSWGGYATYGLITLTNKFQAAVALAGPADYASFYGEFRAAERYSDTPLAFPLTMYMLESANQLLMAQPPWKDMARYSRNSPLSYVERVETPLMIIHGDMDIVPIQQAEQFFSALYRQNKRARFVRYWGEGHVLQSPANICDMWQRIYAWFDQYLGTPPARAAPR